MPLNATKIVMPENNSQDNIIADDIDAFREFVNNYVAETTEFKTAEELLNSKISFKFPIVCLIIALSGIIMPPLLIFTIPIGYFAALSIPSRLKFNYQHNFFKKYGDLLTDKNFNLNDLLVFLNTHLGYYKQYFHEWGYTEKTTMGNAGAVVLSAAIQSLDSSTEIGCRFGEKDTVFSLISFGKSHTESGKVYFAFSSECNSLLGIKTDAYVCLVKSYPIMRAAVEYYLENIRDDN